MTKMLAKRILQCFGLLVFGVIGCQASKPLSGPSSSNVTEATSLDCGELISRVAAGEDFSGRSLVISGVALNATLSGLVNMGTHETYRSGVFENFVSVYDVTRQVRAGAVVRFKVRVESSRAVKMPNASTLVSIDTAYLE